ncbi:hypothetical protein HWB52_gp27 [Pseudomonas phage Littlefix]|uniref:Uncharacterized protein n=1 Tax=Pseudomonas phage Littlefix TaxID=2079289 RepID=A0A2K9VHT1_9CAUD|nr:hypothetical protein HWB52_gp27 [Pseudomonas phage Littlefix]AUV61842.1 hypothetical protein PsPhLittlefix_gp27 [Pseudomonas phage Littlefix]
MSLVPYTPEQQMTVEQFKAALPDKMKKSVSKEVVAGVINMISDVNLHETFRENLIGYTSVMNDGKHKLESYVNAVKYCTYKVMGKTNIEAYTLTFPDRYQDFVNRGVSPKDIASYVTAYNKGKLVSAIMEQSLIPSWILNQDMYQKALNVQAELMVSAQSEKVRTDAANSILTHLKMPEKAKVELDVSTEANDAIKALHESTMALVEMQQEQIRQKRTTAVGVAEHSLTFDNDTGKQV